ncbi:MAG: HYR domain-containing protein [Saprospiraceae bacterium]|nr:HYR domain-containing protein [Saprospiraceae bacterium]
MKRLIILVLICMRIPVLLSAGTPSGAALDSVSISLDSVARVSCHGGNDGAAFISVSSGLAPFSFLWSNGDTLQNADSLAAGFYSLTVTDAVGDQAVLDSVEIGQPDAITVVTEGGTITCFEPFLILFADYDTTNTTFVWTSDNGFESTELFPVVEAGGDYYFTVTDTINGCSATDTATVIAFLTAPDLTITAGTITCASSTATIQVTTQTPDVVYYWSGPNNFGSTEQNPTVSLPGLYEVVGQDTVYGCIALASATVELDTVPPTADAGEDQILNCHATDIYLNGTASSQGSFSYQWTTVDGQIVEGENTSTPLVSAAGTYTLTVTSQTNGCTATDETTVIQRQPLAIQILDLQNVSCHSAATGTASVAGLGGSGDYSYVWSNGSQTATATDLVAGSYTVVVTDSEDCTASYVLIVNEPAPLAANTSATGQSLLGINDGTASAAPTGGTAPYTYLWNNGGTTDTITGLNPGAYTVIVTDDKGCTVSETTNVNEFPCVITGTATSTPTSCFGGADGSVSIELGNAIAPIDFHWSNGDSTDFSNDLAAGFYTISITDSTNCSLFFTIDITQPTQVSIFELFHEDAPCPTDATGSVTVAVNGGVQPYAFLWSNGSTEATASGLSIGEHSLSLTDANGCSQTLTTTILGTDDQAPTLVLNDFTALALDSNGIVTITPDVLDDGSFDACGIANWSVTPNSFDCSQIGEQVVTITATDTNGNSNSALAVVIIEDKIVPSITCPSNVTLSECKPVLDFQLPVAADNCASNSAALLQTEGLASGSTFPLGETVQSFSYTDAGGNTATCSFTVTVNPAMEIGLTTADASCNGACDGGATIFPSNGVAPYQVIWSNDASTLSVSGLCAGDYAATLTDASGCEAQLTVQIAEPTLLTVELDSVAYPSCPSDESGFISVNVAGGTLPYSIEWTNGTSGNSINHIGAGTYSLQVTDAIGCTTSFVQVLTATDQEAPQLLLLNNLSLVLGADGTSQITPSMIDTGTTDNCGIDGWSISPSVLDCGDLGTHPVTVVVSDAAGNTSAGTISVTLVDNTTPTVICPQNISVGSCNAVVTFSLPLLSDNCTINPAALIQTAGLPSGSTFLIGSTTQTFTYSDASGNAATCSFTITVANPLVVSATAINASCDNACDGEVTLNITSGAGPFEVLWSNGQTGLTATGLCSGFVSATITDAFGCENTFTTTISDPPALNLSIAGGSPDVNGQGVGSISINVSGGTQPYSFAWTKDGDSFSNAQNLTGLNAGTYAVEVTDANGCIINSIEIIIENLTGTDEPAWANGLRLFPNPATDWTQLSIGNPLPVNCELRMLDQLGRIALSTNISKGEVQRTIDLSALTPGTYTLMLRNEQEVVVRKLIVQ